VQRQVEPEEEAEEPVQTLQRDEAEEEHHE
jgi:hypothetical protein